MTPLEERILAAVRARPGSRVFELAEQLERDARGVESGLRLLERSGLVTRGADAAGVTSWTAVAGEEDAA